MFGIDIWKAVVLMNFKFTVWDKRFMQMAELIGSWSKDTSHKIGAVIVDNEKRIVSTGFNGFAKNIKDSKYRLTTKEVKRSLMLHAEVNAILYAKRDLKNCTIYVYGLPCCCNCASTIIQSGIKKVIYKNTRNGGVSDYWRENINTALALFKEAGVKVKEMK